MMGLKRRIISEFRKPTGIAGWIVGWLMSVKNNERVRWTIQKLRVNPEDILLEVGFGPGVTVEKIAAGLTTGCVIGVDHAKTMVQQASRRNKRHIENRKVKLECGTVWDLKYPEYYFDIIYGSNVHFFWKDPTKEFKHLVSLLKPSGKLVMVFQPRWTKNEEEVRKVANETIEQYKQVGLTNIEMDFKPMKPVTCICISGQKKSIVQ